jgi:hypothetical protein
MTLPERRGLDTTACNRFNRRLRGERLTSYVRSAVLTERGIDSSRRVEPLSFMYKMRRNGT